MQFSFFRKQDNVQPFTESELKDLTRQAKKIFPERAAYFARIMGVSYGRIAIRKQKTRWGSCSSKKNLNFNALLVLAPPEVLDCVVVHELCHLKQMNHSKKFYDELAAVCPGYKECNKWLRTEGTELIKRLIAYENLTKKRRIIRR